MKHIWYGSSILCLVNATFVPIHQGLIVIPRVYELYNFEGTNVKHR